MNERVGINRTCTAHNPFQGKYKKVLCCCAAGVLRSPTCSWILSQDPYNHNTRACGMAEGIALIPLTETLIEWADEIVCMDSYQEQKLKGMTEKPVINLQIGDCYEYRDPELVELIKTRYKEKTKE